MKLSLAKVLGWSCSVFNSKWQLLSSAVTFANSVDADQARQNITPDLVPNCLTP